MRDIWEEKQAEGSIPIRESLRKSMSDETVQFREARPSDVDEAARLIYSSGPTAFDFVFSRKAEQSLEFLCFAFLDGAGEMGDSLVAASMGSGFSVGSISAGYYNSCVLTSTKRIKCWGIATNGALLNASTTTNLGDVAGELGDSLPWVNH